MDKDASTKVYLLWLDYSVLDVYTDPRIAFEDAQTYLLGSNDRWVMGRPGRWFARGRLLEVEERDVKTVAGRIAA